VLLHGSCFNPEGSRHAMDGHAAYLAERGFVSVVVDYRLGDRGTYPEPVRDVKCAVRWLKSNAAAYGVDPDRIALLGASAGGLLASLASATTGLPEFDAPACGDERVDASVAAVVALYAVSDLETRCRRGQVRPCEERFLAARCDPAHPSARFGEASVVRYAERISVPFLLLHGSEDDDVQVEQSEILADRLRRRGADVTYQRYEGAGHGFELERGSAASEHALRTIAEFLASRIGAPRAAMSEPG
jgi:acetyl esterase/lipase